MRVSIREADFDRFAEQAVSLGEWLHHFNFNNRLITGYYKYQTGDAAQTIARLGDDHFEQFKALYSALDHSQLREYFRSIVAMLDLRPQSASALELGASSGQLSMWLADDGFTNVASSEIRKVCCDQQRLIFDATESGKYRNTVEIRNDTLSIDDPAFPSLFNGRKFDLVVCSRTLNHLGNPVQAIRNMIALSSRYVFIYAMGMVNPLPSRMCAVTVATNIDLTSSIGGATVTPHYWWIPQNAKWLGAKCEISQPDIYATNNTYLLKGYTRKAQIRLSLERLLALAGLKIGHAKTLNPKLMERSGLNPLYFGYLLKIG